MSKTKRNAPCPCGSGHKYKKCCEPKEKKKMEEGTKIVTPHSLKNEFRNEVKKEDKGPVEIETERVGEAEMLRRDQYVAMRQLQVQKMMMAKDTAFNISAIDEYNDFADELAALPLSQGRGAVASMIRKQVELLAKQVEQSKFGRTNVITLNALEAVFNEDREYPDEVEPPKEFDDTPVLLGADLDNEPEELRDD